MSAARKARVPALAKINLGLHVLYRRADGFHEIRTVLQTIVARTELKAPDPSPERTRLRNVTLVPHRGAQVVMSRRREAAQPVGAGATYA